MGFRNIDPEMLSIMQAISRSKESMDVENEINWRDLVMKQNSDLSQLRAENARLQALVDEAVETFGKLVTVSRYGVMVTTDPDTLKAAAAWLERAGMVTAVTPDRPPSPHP